MLCMLALCPAEISQEDSLKGDILYHWVCAIHTHTWWYNMSPLIVHQCGCMFNVCAMPK